MPLLGDDDTPEVRRNRNQHCTPEETEQVWLTVQRTRAALDRHMREHSGGTTVA